MGKRREAREYTLQLLFQIEFNEYPPEQILSHFWRGKRTRQEVREYCGWLFLGIHQRRHSLDAAIQSVSEHWRVSRMAHVDRNILRMAAYELLFEEELAPPIVINEAIEIAKKFSSEQAAVFINGILDAMKRDLTAIRERIKEEENVP